MVPEMDQFNRSNSDPEREREREREREEIGKRRHSWIIGSTTIAG